MNIHHSSKRFNLFEPKINFASRHPRFSNVLSLYPLEFDEEDTEQFIQSLIKLVAYSKIFAKDNFLQLALAHLTLGLAYVNKKSYWKQGEQHAAEGILHAENLPHSRDQISVLIECYYLLGYCGLKQGKRGEALEAATAARNCVEDLGYLDHKLDDEMQLKVTVLAASCSPSALQLLEEALESPGAGVKDVYIHQMIAQFHREAGNPESALKAAKQSHLLTREEEDLALQADAARSLGECYLECGSHGSVEEGIGLLRQAIGLYTSHFSGLHIHTLSTYDILITALIKQEMHAEAAEELSAIKEAKVLKFGGYSKQVSDLHKSLGSVYLLQSKTKEALSQFKSCISILNVIQTKPNELTLSIRNIIKSLEDSSSVKPMFKLY